MEPDPKPLLLILHPDPDTGRAVERLLREGMASVETLLASDEAQLHLALEGAPPTMVVGSDRVVGGDPTQLLGLIAGPGKDIPFIALMGGDEALSEHHAEHMLALGARDVVRLDEPLRLRLAVQRELEGLAQRRTLRSLRDLLRTCDTTLRELLEHSPSPAACVTPDGHLYANPPYIDLFGFHSLESLRDTPPSELFPESDRDALAHALENETVEWHKNIHVVGHDAVLALRRSVLEGRPCTLLTLRTEPLSRRLNEKLDYVGNRDRLSGLYNRGFFMEELALATGRPGHTLLYLHLERFEALRECHGQSAANRLLRELAALLQHPLADGESAARYGGPRFALILRRDVARSEPLAKSLGGKIAAHEITHGGERLSLGAAIGLCPLDDESDADTALEHAQLAAALAAGSQGCHTYRQENDAESRDRQRDHWQRRLLAALDGTGDDFRLVYQPIVYLHASPVDLFEVLLRMVDAHGETLLPRQFLPLAERAGLSGEVDRWVIDAALHALAEHRRGGRTVRFFIKLSSASLLDEGLADWLKERLLHHGLSGDALVVELTERDAATHPAALHRALRELKALRCGLALEQFGLERFGVEAFGATRSAHEGFPVNGKSDRALIDEQPFDYFKFDGALTHRLAANPRNRERVATLSRKVQQAGKRTIVQFVEDTDTLTLLWDLGIHYIQGYLLQAPDTTLHYDFDEPPL